MSARYVHPSQDAVMNIFFVPDAERAFKLDAIGLAVRGQGVRVPDKVVLQIVTTLGEDQKQATGRVSAERSRLENALISIPQPDRSCIFGHTRWKDFGGVVGAKLDRMADGRGKAQNGCASFETWGDE